MGFECSLLEVTFGYHVQCIPTDGSRYEIYKDAWALDFCEERHEVILIQLNLWKYISY